MENKSHLTFKQKMQLHEIMKTHIVKQQDGLYKYINGIVNDIDMAEKASKIIDCRITGPIVRKLRDDMFGKVKPTPNVANGDLDKRVTAIEEYLTRKNPTWRDEA